ncbi:DMT family transporter [Bacillus aquiflavi]|uniref:DMT family transporter n=1 Tax=Bacillus aquiflavi TaxID=2672567 RepID=A0A6B3VZJ9_9BACI|nr:DMT family transporter [Bacillus aquiflavi]MBA4536981.1 DMT family transporter [Bacillus aquiflavi]NEY82678.1 DMT family transporter [Bacillus aquiflavi]
MRLYSALISLSFIWGLSFVFIKWLTEFAGVWGTVFYRCIAGTMILLPFLLVKRKQIAKPIPWKHLIVIGIFNAGLPWGFISLSETYINSNTASVINALTPIFSGIIGFIIFSKSLSKQQWIGILIGFIGIFILLDFNIDSLFGQSFIGIGTMIVATLFYGFASQYMKRYLKETGVLLITTCSLIVGAGIGLFGSFVSGENLFDINVNPLVIISIIGLGCFGSGLAHLLYYYLMKEASPEFATTVTYLIPVTAMIWGYVLLNEKITNNLLIGLIVICSGVYFTNKQTAFKQNTKEDVIRKNY